MSEQITIDVTVTGETIINEVAVSGEVITTVINEAARGASTMPIVKSASFTADNGLTYHAIATLTVTDPTPESGKGFTVLVRNGTSTVGGTAYATAGTVIIRTYHSGAWANYVYQVSGTFAPLVHTHVSADITDSSSLGNSNVLVKYGSQGNLFGLSTSAPALSSNATTSGSGITATANTGTAGIFASTAGNHLNAGNGAFVIANNGNVTGTGTFTASNLSGTNTGNETGASIAALITAATAKTVIVDADVTDITDSEASHGFKKVTFTSIWTWISTKLAAITSQTIGGAISFASTTRPTSSGTGTAEAISLITRTDADSLIGERLFAYKTSDTSRSSTTTHANDPHMILALTAGTWEIVAMVMWLNADGTGGVKSRLNYTGSWTTADSFFSYRYFASSGGVAEATGSMGYVKGASMANPLTMLAVTIRSGYMLLEGQIKVTTSGNLSVQWAQNASSATASIVPQGAYIIARKLA